MIFIQPSERWKYNTRQICKHGQHCYHLSLPFPLFGFFCCLIQISNASVSTHSHTNPSTICCIFHHTKMTIPTSCTSSFPLQFSTNFPDYFSDSTFPMRFLHVCMIEMKKSKISMQRNNLIPKTGK